jgi:hypothetical protein
MDDEGVDEEVEVEHCTQSLIFPKKSILIQMAGAHWLRGGGSD